MCLCVRRFFCACVCCILSVCMCVAQLPHSLCFPLTLFSFSLLSTLPRLAFSILLHLASVLLVEYFTLGFWPRIMMTRSCPLPQPFLSLFVQHCVLCALRISPSHCILPLAPQIAVGAVATPSVSSSPAPTFAQSFLPFNVLCNVLWQ